ncbi:TniQ family protein [Bosea thiooxidans]
MSARFPNRRGTYPLEPAIALVLRRAFANRIWTKWRAWRFVGTSPDALRRGKHIARVSEACGVPLPDLEWATPVKHGNQIRVFGHSFLPDSVRKQYRRWCPACLGEESYHRGTWDIAALSHCVRHQLPLQAECPSCKQPTAWSLGDVSRCQCGQSLPLLNVGKVQESQLAFDKWLDAKLMQHSPAAPLQTELVPCPILDELPLQDAISIVERLGAFSINPVETFAETWSSYGPAAVMLRGYEVASAGERGIEEVLDKLFDARKERDARVRDAGGKPRRWGVQAAYGGAFALWFSGRVDAGSYASLVPVVVRHAKSRVLLKSGFEIFGISDSETSLTLTRAAKHCGISRRRLNEFLRSIGVVPPGKHQGMPLRIPVEVADEYRKRFANSVNMTEAEKLFGISDGAIIELVKAKVLPALIEGGGKLQDYAIETKEITGLLNRLEVRSLNEPSPSHVALPKAFSGKSGILELVGFVLNGQLSVRSVDQDAVGLNRLMVDRADVLQLNRDAAADEMTLQRAAERLNIKWEAVRQLVALGHLKLAGRYIDREQLISFETHFIKGSDVATMLSMHWKWASRKLAQMGIEPAIDRSQCRSVFYERSKIEALVQRSGEADTPEAERFTPREAGDRLGISSAAVLRLIQSGRIAGTEILSNWLIDADALTDFEARHLKLSEAAKLLEIGTRLIEGRLESQGIHLSIDRSECGVAFYDKQTILALAA